MGGSRGFADRDAGVIFIIITVVFVENRSGTGGGGERVVRRSSNRGTRKKSWRVGGSNRFRLGSSSIGAKKRP